MSAKEILEEKFVFGVEEIMILCGLKKGRAYKLIRSIKAYQDRLDMTGKVLKEDYLAYMNRDVRKE